MNDHYSVAGCNTTDKCLIGLHGHVFNISDFVEDHPGSTETLLLQAGRDATVFFESMGHSLGARKMALNMSVVVNGASCDLRTGSLGLIKPTCKSLGNNKNAPGYLIPRKRSRPRFQAGLYRIRQHIRMEEGLQLANAQTWANESLENGMFGGVQVYYDPILSTWRWWYTDRDFNIVYRAPT